MELGNSDLTPPLLPVQFDPKLLLPGLPSLSQWIFLQLFFFILIRLDSFSFVASSIPREENWEEVIVDSSFILSLFLIKDGILLLGGIFLPMT